MQSRRQEQPTFEAGDRFLLRRHGIQILDITREAEGTAEGNESTTFWEDFPAGLKGIVLKREVWSEEPDGLTLCFTLQFDACPHRKILYIAYHEYGGPFEQVAAKSINLN